MANDAFEGEYAELDTVAKMCNDVFQTSGALLWPDQNSPHR